MPLHLLKLCVGCESIGDLRDWIEENKAQYRRLGRPYSQTHTTRMTPKRGDELLDGGSLYWIVRGHISCRQSLLAMEQFTDADGIGRCRLELNPIVVPVAPRPFRPFQGWRYLKHEDAPPDLLSEDEGEELPEELRRELAHLGLL